MGKGGAYTSALRLAWLRYRMASRAVAPLSVLLPRSHRLLCVTLWCSTEMLEDPTLLWVILQVAWRCRSSRLLRSLAPAHLSTALCSAEMLKDLG